jgi:hypothetical protein
MAGILIRPPPSHGKMGDVGFQRSFAWHLFVNDIDIVYHDIIYHCNYL